MKTFFKYILVGLILICSYPTIACTTGEHQLIIEIVPDQFPQEVSWNIVTSSGTFVASGILNDTLCISDSLGCLIFTIYDSYGDGICCDYGNGYYNLIWDSMLVHTGGNYLLSEMTSLNCIQGDFCDNPVPVDTLSYAISTQHPWYLFNPPINGIYEVSTCDTLNNCDTKLWIYETCPSNPTDSTNMQTIFFNDNNVACGNLAIISGAFDSSKTYIIRVGSASGVCDSIRFSIEYTGPVVGCMDPTACNYLPIAEQAGVCYYFPDTLCGYPDLSLDKDYLLSSLGLSNKSGDYCEVQEGCMNGYNTRTTLDFATKIDNIGNLDYYIGDPYNDPSQFSFNNCHGHPHYEGYAKYALIDTMGNTLPIGSKTGFCVIDLVCPDQDMYKYSCDNMGISAGCSDIYDVNVGCQFIDITEVDSGYYTLRVEVNWDHSPDKLGRYERTYDNNFAEVCIYIGIDIAGVKYFNLDPTCNPWKDCAGVDHGTAVRDCNGNCSGTALYGDVNASTTQSIDDAHDYLTGILNQSIPPSPCFDLYRDTLISIYDAALIQKCSEHGTFANDYCSFPKGRLIPMSGVELSVENYNTTDHYFDVYIKNPLNILMGYEFTINGGSIINVKNLLTDIGASIEPEFIIGGQKIIALAYTDSFISKHYVAVPLCRVYYSDTSSAACLDTIVHIVSSDAELVNTAVDLSGCPVIAEVSKYSMINNNLFIFPNPSKGYFSVGVYLAEETKLLDLEVYNVMGQLIYQTKVINNAVSNINLPTKTMGIYKIEVKSKTHQEIRKIVIE